jgi:hypothetical protein
MIILILKIRQTAISADSKSLVSVQDGVLNIWSINYAEFDDFVIKNAVPNPYLQLLESEAAPGHSRRKEMEDFFYYLQLKRQGEQVTAARQVSTTIPIDDIPYLMQAMGYYPTIEEISTMMDEIRLSKLEETGETCNEVGLDDLIKCNLNDTLIG